MKSHNVVKKGRLFYKNTKKALTYKDDYPAEHCPHKQIENCLHLVSGLLLALWPFDHID